MDNKSPDATCVQDQDWLDTLFPPSRTDAFFDALFGGAEEGAYDIKLTYIGQSQDTLTMAFTLLQRPGKCLRCNLTYGLPEVFARHPILDAKGLAATLAQAMQWDSYTWSLGHTEEVTNECHHIPFRIKKA